jgi:hypothetical protein
LQDRILVVGLTFVDPQGNLLDQFQTAGRVEGFEADGTVMLRQLDGRIFRIPSEAAAFRRAEPGSFRIRHSGQVVENPDFMGHWEVNIERAAEMERYRDGGFPLGMRA